MLIQNGANVNNLTMDGFYPLRIAAQGKHVAIAESLIRQGRISGIIVAGGYGQSSVEILPEDLAIKQLPWN